MKVEFVFRKLITTFIFSDLVFQKHISPPSSYDSNLVQASFRTFEFHKQRREVMHRAITFLMKFMADVPREQAIRDREAAIIQASQSTGSARQANLHLQRDNFHDSKTQNSLFRLLYHLFGFNPTLRTITVEPERFRRSVVFNAFIGNLPSLVDNNFEITRSLLPTILTMMHHCCVSSTDDCNKAPTLAPLHHFVRRDWLIALTTLLYKYDYGTDPFFQENILKLMTIVIATLHSATHDCIGALSPGDVYGYYSSKAFQQGIQRSQSLTNMNNQSSSLNDFDPLSGSMTPGPGSYPFFQTMSQPPGSQEVTPAPQSAKSGGFPFFPKKHKGKGNLTDIFIEATKTSISNKHASQTTVTPQGNQSAADDSESALAKRRCMAACSLCGEPILSMTNEAIGLCVVSLCTFVHREPSVAAQLLPDALQIVARVAVAYKHFWQKEEVYVHVPGNCVSVSRQFIRLTLSQLRPNGIIPLLFASRIVKPRQFFGVVAAALQDYHDLTNGALILDLVKNMNAKKTLNLENTDQMLANFEVYLTLVTNESVAPPEDLEIQVPHLLTKLSLSPPIIQQANKTLFSLLNHLFRILYPIAGRDLLESVCKLVSAIMRDPNTSVPVSALSSLFNAVSRCYAKERDRRIFVQFVCSESLQVIRCTGAVNYANAISLLLFISLDVCRVLLPLTSHLDQHLCDPASGLPLDEASLANHPYIGSNISLAIPANVADLLKPYLTDLMTFLTDLHAIFNMKNALKGLDDKSLSAATGGGYVKSVVAQIAASLLADATAADVRSLGRILPWLLQTTQTNSPDV